MKLYTDIKDWFKRQFTLVDNWRTVLKKSLTVWFAVGSAFFGAVEYWHEDFLALLPILTPFLPKGVAGAISSLITAAIPFVRIKKQVALAIAEAEKAAVVNINVDVSGGDAQNLSSVTVEVDKTNSEVKVNQS